MAKWKIIYRINDNIYCPISVYDVSSITELQDIIIKIKEYGYFLIDVFKVGE